MPVTTKAPIYSAPTPPVVDNAKGVVLMLAAFFLFSAVDAMAKFLTADFHPIQVVWTRQLGLLVGVVVLLAVRGSHILRTRAPGWQIARGAIAAMSATLFIVAVSFVPLADAVAVSFVAPLIVTILGAFVLKEPVGLRRWIAVVLGFVGMLIVVRPGAGVIHPAVLLVVLAAALFAGRQIISRKLSGADPLDTTVAYTALTASLVLTVPLPFFWTTPTSLSQIALMVLFATLAGAAEFLAIKALDIAHAVVLAPLHYSLIIWGTFYGWIIFDQLPDLWTWIGASVIVATGLYTIHRERLAAKRQLKTST